MKFIFLTFLVLILGCKTEEDTSKKNTESNKNVKTFFVGDINNDKINDTAFVSQKENFELKVSFSNKAADIEFESLGCIIKKIDDLNGDNANEILIFSRTHEGWWNTISILTFKNKKWEQMAKTKGFISNNQDLENRVIEENGNFYLIGEDQWNEDENGAFLKIKVRI